MTENNDKGEKAMFDDRTLYKITDEHGAPSSITLDKTVADVLQMHLPDVHAWVQNAYNFVVEKKPDISRTKQGDFVRALATKEAKKYPEYDQIVKDFLSML